MVVTFRNALYDSSLLFQERLHSLKLLRSGIQSRNQGCDWKLRLAS